MNFPTPECSRMRKMNFSSPGVHAWETVFIQLGCSPIYGAFRDSQARKPPEGGLTIKLLTVSPGVNAWARERPTHKSTS